MPVPALEQVGAGQERKVLRPTDERHVVGDVLSTALSVGTCQRLQLQEQGGSKVNVPPGPGVQPALEGDVGQRVLTWLGPEVVHGLGLRHWFGRAHGRRAYPRARRKAPTDGPTSRGSAVGRLSLR